MKIAVDLGHGIGQDRGAVGIIAEEQIINSVGELVIQGLEKQGNEVIEVRPRVSGISVSQSLNYRVTTSNNFKADLYISIHANAGGGQGTEVFTYKAKRFNEANNVLNNLVSMGFINRGIKDGKGLYVIRHTAATAMLIEICFVDSKADVEKYNRIGAKAIANAIVYGITNKKVTDTNETNIVNTDNWVKRLQKQINAQGLGKIAEDGIAGPITLSKAPLLKLNSTGGITKLLQEKLGVTQDGIFGNITKRAVIQFQRKNGLKQDGIVGRQTWKKLLQL